MKIGDILFNIYVASVAVPVILSVIYWAVAGSITYVQERKYDFGSGGSVVEARGIKYEGRMSYSPVMPLPWQDRNGYAEVKLMGNERAFLRYEDLTALTLEGRIMVENSEGEEAEFDEKIKYDRETLEDVSELEEALESVGSDKSIRDIVEQEIKEAIAGR